jgi:anthranilate synthase component I
MRAQYRKQQAAGYKKIPLVRELLVDMDTPVSTFLKLANRPYSYLFESVVGGEKWARYSIIGLPAVTTLEVNNGVVTVMKRREEVERLTPDNPLDWIENYQSNLGFASCETLPIFTGGLVGYFGYETVHYIEPRLTMPERDVVQCPDIMLMVSEEVLVFDNLNCRLYIITHADAGEGGYERGMQRLDELEQELRTAVAADTVPESDYPHATVTMEFDQNAYQQAVETIKNYIRAGDAMQVVLSQRTHIDYPAHPFALYRALRSLNPSPYMFYLDFGEFQVVGSSPEILVRLEQGEVTVRPIAGTRPRGHDEVEDIALEHDLLADPKELAEHLMLNVFPLTANICP